MRHVTSLEEAGLSRPSVVTIGSFDGVHRGHQYLLRHLVEQADEMALAPVVLTFYPHPRMVLGGFEPGFYLTLPPDRARLLGQLGVELVITLPFNDELRHMRAADFVDQLVSNLQMRSLWVGEDFALGYQREGDVPFLRAAGQERGFTVRVVDLMDAGSERVSSSRVRQALREGKVEEAARLLGRPHFVTGVIAEGAKRGRTLGFPTANLRVPVELAVPARGVYAGWAYVRGQVHPAFINVGRRPTFEGDVENTVEAYLLDYSGDLYGAQMHLSFVARLRDEQKFSGVDELVVQIRRDVEAGRAILAQHPPQLQIP